MRVACVGNSVTYGVGVKDRATEAYPAQLQRMLGDGYEVGSFGHSGTTLLRHGSNPYTRTEEYRAALDFRADIVVIHLGLNDTDPRNWPQYADEFIPDYRALVADFRRANPKARVWLCLMTPIFHGHRRFDSGTRDWHALIQRRIAQVARTDSTGLIDLYTPLHCHPDLFPDALHPNAEGAAILARTVCAALTGRYGGLRLPQPYGDGMVLQRGQTIRLHGTADAGTPVRVRFDDLERTDTAGADGRWQVDFPARPAGGPYEIDFAAGKERRTLRDVWVGEVWLCSGQSNMAFPLRSAATAAADLAAADYGETFAERNKVAQSLLTGVDVAAVEARNAVRTHDCAARSPDEHIGLEFGDGFPVGLLEETNGHAGLDELDVVVARQTQHVGFHIRRAGGQGLSADGSAAFP